MNIDLSLVLLCASSASNPFKRATGFNQASTHDKVGMDRDGIGDSWDCVLFLLDGGVTAALERAENLDKALALILVGKVLGVVAGSKSSFPGDSPDLQEMDGVLFMLVELAVGDTGATRGELDITTMHSVELV